MTNAVNTQTILNEINALIACPKFRQGCADVAKALGCTAEEWNANRAKIYFMYASQIVTGNK